MAGKKSKNKEKPSFSYPYNFVSLGDEEDIERNLREDNKGTYTGKFKCTLTNKTALFIAGDISGRDHKVEKFLKEENKYIIPASTLKGEVRNIIEAFTHSCIRNIDNEGLEYRIKDFKGNEKNQFGIIKHIPTDEEDTGLLHLAERIKIKKSVAEEYLKKYNVKPLGKNKEGFYKIYINNLAKLKEYIAPKNNKPSKDDAYAVNTLEQLEELMSDHGEEAIIWIASPSNNKVYEKMLVSKKYTEKLKSKENEKYNYVFSYKEYKDLLFLINQRAEREEKNDDNNFYLKDKYIENIKLEGNEVIIFREFNADDKSVGKLVFSEIPSLRYKLSPNDLVPEKYRSCSGKNGFCFGCNLFGSTGNEASEKNTAFKGKVCFTDATSEYEETKKYSILKPLGEPHPSLIRFYLEGTYENKNSQIRGRKFYWHHKDKIDKAEGYLTSSLKMAVQKNEKGQLIKDSDKSKYNSTIYPLAHGKEFKFEVAFENLTEEELGMLIYGLELEEGMGHKIGKAKSFGLGSCIIKIDEILFKNKERYKQFSKPYISMEKEEKDFIRELVKEKYVDVNKKEIDELKYILSFDNSLNFKPSPFPEEKDEKGNYSTLEWFKKNKDIKLAHILDYKNS